MLLEPPYRQMLIMAVTGLLLTLLAFLGYRSPPDRRGWRRIRPSPMHWMVVYLGGGLVLLFLYVRLFVGSARADAEFQMNVLTGLIVVFGSGVVLCGWLVLRLRQMAFEWRGSTFAYNTPGGQRVTRDVAELTELHWTWMDWLVLTFPDGEMVKLDGNARGSLEFVHSVVERRPDLFPEEYNDED